jgi:hypothetical protein
VKRHRIHQPVDDPAYVLIELDFGSAGEAEEFLGFLTNQVWSTPQNAPALAGAPKTRILELREEG